jgi:polyribonucleotide nucleotidyltransferase
VDHVESIPPERIGQFVGKSGNNLDKLEALHCVSIDVGDSGSVRISGLPDDVAVAAGAVRDFACQQDSEMVLSELQVKMLKSNKGQPLKDIESLLGVSLAVGPSRDQLKRQAALRGGLPPAKGGRHSAAAPPSPSSPSAAAAEAKALATAVHVTGGGVLRMRGSPQAMALARVAVFEITAATEWVQLAPNGVVLRRLLGNAGAELRQLERQMSVGLNVSRADARVSVTGSAARVAETAALLRQMASEQELETLEIEMEDSEAIAAIIGKKGATVRRIQDETGVSITIDRREGEAEVEAEAGAEATAGEQGEVGADGQFAANGASKRERRKQQQRKSDQANGPGDATATRKIVLRAPAGKLPLAKAAIDEVVAQHRRENAQLRFSEDLHSVLFGSGGAHLKMVQEAVGPAATVALQRRDGHIIAFARGSADGVAKACALLRAAVDAIVTDTVPVPEEARAVLIGPKGANMAEMQKRSGAAIQLPAHGPCELRGSKEQVALARAEVEAVLDKFRRENRVLLVLSSATGALIGRGGATLKSIREASGATIDVALHGTGEFMQHHPRKVKSGAKIGEEPEEAAAPAEKDQFGTVVPVTPVRLRGEPAQIEAAVRAINELVGPSIVSEADRRAYRELRVPVPSQEATRKLVGKQGETVRSIEQRFAVKVTVDRDGKDVTVRGRAGPSMVEAVAEVRDVLEQGVVVREKLQGLSSQILDRLADAAALRRVQDECGVTLLEVAQEAAPPPPASKQAPAASRFTQTQSPPSAPPAAGTVSVLLVEGSGASVRACKAILADIERGIERETLKVAPEHVARLASDQASNVARMEQQFGVRIALDLPRCLVRLVGRPAELARGKAGVLRLLRFLFPGEVASVPLPAAQVISVVIGKQGKAVRKLQQDHGVSVSIARETLTCDIIGASKDAVAAAAAEIALVCEAYSKENTTLPVPSDAIATLIGRKGATIQRIRQDSGVAAIDVDRDASCLRFRGSQQAVAAAAKAVQEVVERFQKENVPVAVDPDSVAWIIGKGGATIQAVQDETGAKVRIDKDSSIVVITGTEPAIAAAREHILALALEYAEQRRVIDERRAAEAERRRAETEERRAQLHAEKLKSDQRRRDQELALANGVNQQRQQYSGPVVGSTRFFAGDQVVELDTTRRFEAFALRGQRQPEQPDRRAVNAAATADVMSLLLGHSDLPSTSYLPAPPTTHTLPLASAPPGFGAKPPTPAIESRELLTPAQFAQLAQHKLALSSAAAAPTHPTQVPAASLSASAWSSAGSLFSPGLPAGFLPPQPALNDEQQQRNQGLVVEGNFHGAGYTIRL